MRLHRSSSVRRSTAFTIALVALVSVLGVVPMAAPAGADVNPQFMTVDIASGTPGTVYATVIDNDPVTNDETWSVVELDATTGDTLRTVADLGTTVIEAMGAAPGRVTLADAAGTIHTYRRLADGYAPLHSWPVSVPGVSGDVFVGGLAPFPDGRTAAIVVVSHPTVIDPFPVPEFAGVLLYDSVGDILGMWKVPVSLAEPKAFVLPDAVDVLPSGEIFVAGIPCQGAICGSPVVDTGWLFQIDVERARPSWNLSTGQQWDDSLLVNATSVAVIDDTHVVTLSDHDEAVELDLSGGSVTRDDLLALDLGWTAEDVANSWGAGDLVDVLEHEGTSDVERVHRFQQVGDVWTSLGTIPASWDSM
jgi:hypothetical protein